MSDKVSPMTMKDIAKELGVSPATVSRALKDSPRISKETREKIKAFAKEHNFTPNALAENLRYTKLKPQKIIGVIVPQYTHYYFSSILSGIDKEASKQGYSLMVAESEEKYEEEVRICKKFQENKVCGIIISQAKDTTKYDHFQSLISAGMPIVFCDRICTGIDASRVVVDDYQGAYNAVEHLIKTGCRHIAFFGAPKNLEISKNRYNGYKDAMQKNKLAIDEDFVRIVCDTRENAEEETLRILEGEKIPDAFFAVNDESAIGILLTAKRMGYRIPEDISVCGFTNSNQATVCDPMLTTVEQRGVEVGKEAANIIINKVEGKTPKNKIEKRVVRTRLVVRGSTR